MLIEDHLSRYITIFTPHNPMDRGCQLSLTFPAGNMMDVFSKLCEAGIVCDERKPDVIRVAPTPLYNSYADVWEVSQGGRLRRRATCDAQHHRPPPQTLDSWLSS